MSSQEDINPDSSPDTPTAANSKDAFFDPKPQPKIIRVLTVMAYVLSVSMAAILLSIYYIFMWDGRPHLGAQKSGPNFGVDNTSSSASEFKSEIIYRNRPSNNSVIIFHYGKGNQTLPVMGKLVEYYEKEKSDAIDSLLKVTTLKENFTSDYGSSTEKMSYKAANGINLTHSDSQQWKTASLLDTTVKFAGEEAKDRLYEPKHKKKLVRVLTVVAYVFFVSLAAIMLSLYYVFLWNGDQKIAAKYVTSTPRRQKFYGQNCDDILAEMHQQFIAVESEQLRAYTTSPSPADENNTDSNDYESIEDLGKTSPFIKKLMGNYEGDY